MTLSSTGELISAADVEVLNVSRHGLWILVSGREYFLPFEDFPWFRNAAISDILIVELPHPDHLYWPRLDVDLHLDSIDHLDKYPLVYQG